MRERSMIWRVLYWLAVFAVSLVLVVALILFFESRDSSSLPQPGAVSPMGWTR